LNVTERLDVFLRRIVLPNAQQFSSDGFRERCACLVHALRLLRSTNGAPS
jgi:hypothetical protein